MSDADPVFPIDAPGKSLSAGGGGMAASAIPSPSSFSAVLGDFWEESQSLTIEYCRIPELSVQPTHTAPSMNSAISLSGVNNFEWHYASVARSRLQLKVTANYHGRRVVGTYGNPYSQPQKFKLYPEATDRYGYSYGAVSSLSGVVCGPQGKIYTTQPYFGRFYWSAVSGTFSGALSAIAPISGIQESFEGYTYMLDPTTFLGAPSAGPPWGGWDWMAERKYWDDPMSSRVNGLQDPMLVVPGPYPINKNMIFGEGRGGRGMGSWLSIPGNYQASAENLQDVYQMITDVGKNITWNHGPSVYVTNPFPQRKYKCSNFVNCQDYDPDFWPDPANPPATYPSIIPFYANALQYYSWARHDYS